MKSLLYYDAYHVTRSNASLAGMRRFEHYFRIYNYGVAPVDRSGTVRLPIRTKSLFPLPQQRPFTTSYEAICNARAVAILARAESMGVPISVFWSGGIDSTLVLISLLKNATVEQKARLTVLMSEESIAENPLFYRNHIHGSLTHAPATMFSYMLGMKNIVVNGEHNDQLFGSDIMESVIAKFGPGVIHKPIDRDMLRTLFTAKVGDVGEADFYISLFDRLAEAAPVKVTTTHEYFWWINFVMKWQTVTMRSLAYTARRNFPLITREYVENNYIPFYNTEDFQLWSMNNPDKKILDSWRTYKWAAKEVIYDFTKDADYRDNKIKRGSLAFLIQQQKPVHFIDDEYHFHDEIPPGEYHMPENDFA